MGNNKLSEEERERLQEMADEMFGYPFRNPTGETIENPEASTSLEYASSLFMGFFNHGYELGKAKSSVYTPDISEYYVELFMKLVQYFENYDVELKKIKNHEDLLRSFWRPFYHWEDYLGGWRLFSESSKIISARISYIDGKYRWWAKCYGDSLGNEVEDTLEEAVNRIHYLIDKHLYEKFIGNFTEDEDNPWYPWEDRIIENINYGEAKFDILINGKKIERLDESQLRAFTLSIPKSGLNDFSIVRVDKD